MVATNLLLAAFGVGSLTLVLANYTLQRKRHAALIDNTRI
jgi:hypothetical protein